MQLFVKALIYTEVYMIFLLSSASKDNARDSFGRSVETVTFPGSVGPVKGALFAEEFTVMPPGVPVC